jgi:trehalose 6-phosphate phosphatase
MATNETDLHAFVERARAGPPDTLLALDVDGTVSAIAPSPEEAVVGPELRATLERLAARYPLWFLSGRDADDARRLAGVDGAGYIGAHGLEALDREGLRPLAEGLDVGDELARVAEAVARRVPEAAPYIERKRWGVAFHYRALGGTPQVAARLRAAIEPQLTPRLRLQPGKMVLEVRAAAGRDKGTALAWLIKRLCPRRVLVAGDDLTDLAAFRALAERRGRGGIDGIAVAVRTEETPEELLAVADAEVDGVDGLHALLRGLLGEAG